LSTGLPEPSVEENQSLKLQPPLPELLLKSTPPPSVDQRRQAAGSAGGNRRPTRSPPPTAGDPGRAHDFVFR
jgi:hypothetical protein